MAERSVRTMPAVADKFFPDGRLRPFAGLTVICPIDPASPESEALWTIQRTFAGQPWAEAFAFLPQDSFHMTVFELVNDRNRTEALWSKDLAFDASLAVATEFFVAGWARVAALKPLAIRVAALVHDGFLTLSVEPTLLKDRARLRAYRDELSRATGICKPNHDTYRFHITLAYQVADLTNAEEAEAQQLVDGINRRLGERPLTIVLPSPDLCTFADMGRFTPVDAALAT